MAKRKRLTLPSALSDAALDDAQPDPMFPLGIARQAAPPIAQVAADAAVTAALGSLTDEITAARDEGRLIQALPLAAIDAGYLVRDRMVTDPTELDTLTASIRARGQQVPIEVVALADGAYGLISGWRRLTALRQLQADAPDDPRFARVQAILRRPEAASDAYLAMVEENEIRVGLSYYERARIVARAAEAGVFPDTRAALQRLFAAASRPRRSKIGSFLRIYQALDDQLRFPTAIPERLGLTLAQALEADTTFAPRLRDRLRKTPSESPEAELATLERAARPARSTVRPKADPQSVDASEVGPTAITPNISLATSKGRIILSGAGVTPDLQQRLVAWLKDGLKSDLSG